MFVNVVGSAAVMMSGSMKIVPENGGAACSVHTPVVHRHIRNKQIFFISKLPMRSVAVAKSVRGSGNDFRMCSKMQPPKLNAALAGGGSARAHSPIEARNAKNSGSSRPHPVEQWTALTPGPLAQAKEMTAPVRTPCGSPWAAPLGG